MFLGVLALGSYWLAWWVLLTQAFTFTSWAGLGLAVAIYSASTGVCGCSSKCKSIG
jgi:hypothetical protein